MHKDICLHLQQQPAQPQQLQLQKQCQQQQQYHHVSDYSQWNILLNDYRKVASSNASHFVTHLVFKHT